MGSLILRGHCSRLGHPLSASARYAARARLLRLGFPVFRSTLKITGPNWLHVPAQVVKDAPGIQAGVVAIVEEQAQGIISNGLDAAHAHIFLPQLQRALAAAVASYLRGG